MRSEWREVRLEDVAELTVGYVGTMATEYQDSGVKFLRSLNVRPFEIDFSDIKYISEGFHAQISKSQLKEGDVIIVRTGQPGASAVIPAGIGPLNCSDLVIIHPDESLIDPLFLCAYINISSGVINSRLVGAVQQHFNVGAAKKMTILLPEIETQRKISRIIKGLNEKKEINEKINDNLSEQAQGVLYHFMDEHSFQLQPLSDIAIVIDCLHSKKPSSIEDSIYQLIQLENIRDDGFLDMSATRYMISQADYENWTRKCEIVEGDCVITNVGRIGAVAQAPYGTKAAMGRNMTCIRLKPENKWQAYFITVLLSKHMRRQIQSNTDEGTIMGALNVKNIPKLLFPIFKPFVMTKLEGVLFPLRKQIEYNNLQNQFLAQLRDSLLPKLMSGEIDVSDIAI